MRPRLALSRIPLYVLLIVGSGFMAYPLVFQVLVSFMTPPEYFRMGWLPIPPKPTLENYLVLFAGDVGKWVANTTIRELWFVFWNFSTSILAGYVFSKLRFPGRNLAFIFILSGLMVPGVAIIVPHYLMLARWPFAGGNDWTGQGGSGFINQWPALLLLGMVNIYFIFLMKQSYDAIPNEFEESARVDGANTLQVLWNIYMPMLRPTMAAMFILLFVAIWNDYLGPLIFVGGNPAIEPIALGAQRYMAAATGLSANYHLPNYPLLFAAGTVATIPTIVVYMLFQRYFIEGMASSGLKG